jgi:hypothetical protein
VSCFVVDHGTIDTIVQGMITEGLCPPHNGSMVGRVLLRQNVYAYTKRYQDVTTAEMMGSARQYRFRGIEAPLDPAIVLQQVKCYQYQCIDDPIFEQSPARALVVELARTLEERGVSAAGPWGVADITEAIAR